MRKLAWLAATAIALAACSKSPAHTSEQQAPASGQAAQEVLAPAGNLELGQRIYNFRCYYCHGYSGNAHTLAATLLDPRPVDFTHTDPKTLSRDRMVQSINAGRPGTAMMSFSGILKPEEIAAVTDFIRYEFMEKKAENTRYHTEANGWYNHQRYAIAYPFALGEIPLDTPWEKLTPEQAAGKRLFMTSCVSCHDHAKVNDQAVHWESQAVSYPRNQVTPGNYVPAPENGKAVDAMNSATPYHIHDQPPKLEGLSGSEKRGEGLFQQNCAFCHAADGTARNWIGSFMEPHPRDLVNAPVMKDMTKARLKNVIRDGLKDTSMPAWKSVLTDQQIDDVIAYVGRAFHPLKTD